MSHQHLQQQDHHVLPSGGIALSPTSSSQMAAAGSVRTGQYGNQVVHVRGDSDSDLEALFSVLHSIDGRPPASSFKNRKLPASFFRPPDHKAAMSGGGGQTAHGRSVSSPAQLHHGGGNQQVAHSKPTGSAGVEGFINDLANGSGVSGNWETSKNCPRYYLTPEVGIWQQQEIQQQQHGPMSGLYLSRAGTATAAGNGTMQSHQHSSSSSADFAHQDPLPHGWEEGITPDGEIYFINHVEKTTSWYDPRIPRHSRPSLTSVRGGPHSMVAHNSHTQQQQQHSHLSPKQQQHQQCQMVTHPQMLSNGRSAHSEHFICLELQKLQKEKERLLHEQEAISCREMMLNELVRQSSTCGGVGDGGHIKCGVSSVHAQQQQQQQPEGALAMIQTMQSLYGSSLMSTGGDSFTVPVEPHARQNSTDSGLGGMGTAYSLPRSPDDYLSNVDEMDVQEDVPHMRKSTNSCYLRMTSGNADLGHLSSVGSDMIDDVTVLDGDQLLSSLAGDVTSDLLSEMDVQKIDNMLYL